jgi:hypothetical protein
MSSESPEELTCRVCGNKQVTTLWDSINVTLDPELKDKLFAGEINVFTCEKCCEKRTVNAPLLYHDMTLLFCVQFYPPEALGDIDFFRQFKADGSMLMDNIPAQFAKSGAYLVNPHIVFNMTEMINYVAFRDGIAGLNKAEKSE